MLEGGYNLDALGDSLVDSFLGALGETSRDSFDASQLREEPMGKVRAVLREVKSLHGM